MAQKQRSANARRRQKSAFPVFEYIDMLMPHHLVARFTALPHHVRWTIISAVASVVILFVFLRVVVGSINYWIDTRGPFLKDALYLPYNLMERPVPEYPGVAEEGQFLILPEKIGDFVLQIPPSQEEVKAERQAELDAFVALSFPVEDSLTALRESLGKALGETPVPAEAIPAATEVVATPVVEATPVAEGTTAAEGDVTVVPTAAPTVNPIQIQVTALDNLLATLTPLNEALKTADSIDLVYGSVAQIQGQINSLAASGVNMPLGVEPFKARIDELAAVEPPVIFRNNECLMAAMPVQRAKDETFALPPCSITQRAWFVEQGTYVNSEGKSYNIAVAEFPRTVDSAWALKQLFYRARAIGFTGDFALDNIIDYNYFFSQIETVYSMVWTHDNWVYSVSGFAADDIDAMMKMFPY